MIPAAAATCRRGCAPNPGAPERLLRRLRHALDPRLLRVRSPPSPRPARRTEADANDPERLAAICRRCDERKTPQDLKAIARTKRLAFDHQDFLARQRSKVPGRRAPSRRQVEQLERSIARALRLAPPPKALTAPARPRPLPPTRPRTALAAPTRHRTVLSLPAPKGRKE